MKVNKFLKFLCSLPIILIVLYFIPFLGICLILFRYYVYRNDKYYKMPIMLLLSGLLILMPKIFSLLIETFKLSVNIIYLDNIINSDIYISLLDYSKLLIVVGVIFLILSFLFKDLFTKINNKAREYMKQNLKKDYDIRKENDLKMQEKREKSKNTHVVKCPNCGSSNMLTEQSGTCKFCRQHIEYREEC